MYRFTYGRTSYASKFEQLWIKLLSVCLLEKAMAPHSSTLAWKIPWMEEPGRSMGLLRVWHGWMTSLSFFLSLAEFWLKTYLNRYCEFNILYEWWAKSRLCGLCNLEHMNVLLIPWKVLQVPIKDLTDRPIIGLIL